MAWLQGCAGGCQPPGALHGALALLLGVFVGPGRATRVRKHPKSSWCLSREPFPCFPPAHSHVPRGGLTANAPREVKNLKVLCLVA